MKNKLPEAELQEYWDGCDWWNFFNRGDEEVAYQVCKNLFAKWFNEGEIDMSEITRSSELNYLIFRYISNWIQNESSFHCMVQGGKMKIIWAWHETHLDYSHEFEPMVKVEDFSEITRSLVKFELDEDWNNYSSWDRHCVISDMECVVSEIKPTLMRFENAIAQHKAKYESEDGMTYEQWLQSDECQIMSE